ncbi:hypothetical protein [Devosia marina]|uniref:Secreted protein n=1 Tax=Devosia marina TaxID=2683198 RepID=A0A7X3K514_9HYPH|nr:hypothetical protein [Devosia marina]MVT00972.1 hypothetical protein [Devosia marina]
MKKSLLLSSALSVAAAIAIASPALAIGSGDVPAPVDLIDMAGPGQSHTNGSGISGFDGNQGNDRKVGNAGGGSVSEPIEEPVEEPVDDGGVW